MKYIIISFVAVMFAAVAIIKAFSGRANKKENAMIKDADISFFQKLEVKLKKFLSHWQVIALLMVAYDLITTAMSYFLALWFRFDCEFSSISRMYLDAYVKFIPFYIVIVIGVYFATKLYNSVWRFASFGELIRVWVANIITAIIHTIGITIFLERMPISYYLFGAVIQFCFAVAIRFGFRFVLAQRRKLHAVDSKKRRNVMLIGAGAAGQLILQDSLSSKELNSKICCIIDDNPNKWGRYMANVPIVGGRDDILVNAKKYDIDCIFFAIPVATAEEKRDILNICKETGCELKILPGIYQFVNNEISIKQMKDVDIEDLLGRDPIKVDMTEIFEFLRKKTVLVTGGGGSIGSELCRQIAAHAPEQLIIFEIYENNAYDIEQELRRKYPELNLVVLIGSVRDSRRLDYVFNKYKPDVVYHAAAHKHVPLMETSPCEAIKNNVVGTYKTAKAAMLNGCSRFILISTDKAVNPTNVMGASKRLCEMVVQSMNYISETGKYDLLPSLYAHFESDDESAAATAVLELPKKKTEFVAVRFGNVLGSNGSVIPLFKKQIEAGGPITVTHPDIIRYFMTIPEAVSLVLQAGVYAKGGEIFVLDMGEPVKIDTLARNLIKLSGYKPDVDIKVVYTGLRPGEKLYEEKLMAEEGMETTPNHLIHIGKPIPFDRDEFFKELTDLAEISYNNDEAVVEKVAQMVPTFHHE